MVIEVTEDDLRRASSVNIFKRTPRNCVLAKAIQRQTNGSNISVCNTDDFIHVDNMKFKVTKKINRIMNDFDCKRFSELRQRLPTKIRLMK